MGQCVFLHVGASPGAAGGGLPVAGESAGACFVGCFGRPCVIVDGVTRVSTLHVSTTLAPGKGSSVSQLTRLSVTVTEKLSFCICAQNIFAYKCVTGRYIPQQPRQSVLLKTQLHCSVWYFNFTPVNLCWGISASLMGRRAAFVHHEVRSLDALLSARRARHFS